MLAKLVTTPYQSGIGMTQLCAIENVGIYLYSCNYISFYLKKIATFFIKRVIRRHSGTFTLRTFRRER